MTKKLRSRQFFGNGTAVNGYKRFISSFTELMDTMGYILLSRSAGTINKDRHIGWCHQPHIII